MPSFLLRMLASGLQFGAIIHGSVHIAGHGAAIAHVRIQVDSRDAGSSDGLGSYQVAGIGAGEHSLRFSIQGFDAREISVIVTNVSDLTLDVELTPRVITLPPIIALGLADTSDIHSQTSFQTGGLGGIHFGNDWTTSQTTESPDLQRLVSKLPGITSRSDNASALSIHGGRGSENQILLDGIPLLAPQHFGMATSAINPDAMSSIDIHSGIYSARFGGALSGVIELQTPKVVPSSTMYSGAISSTDAHVFVRTPLGESGMASVGVRASFRNLFTDDVGFGRTNGYEDFISTAHFAIGRGMLSVVGLESGNHLKWEMYNSDSDVPNDGDALMTPRNTARWNTSATGATWKLALTPQSSWQTTGWWTGNTSAIDYFSLPGEGKVRSGVSEFGVRSEMDHESISHRWNIGTELTIPQTRYAANFTTESGSEAGNFKLNSNPVIVAVYSDWDWQPMSGVALSVGMRASSDFVLPLTIDPRATATVNVSPTTRISAGAGRTHQRLQSMLNEDNLASAIIAPVLPVAANKIVPQASATQWELNFQSKISSSITTSLNAYAREWQNTVSPTTSSGNFFVTSMPTFGSGHANGISGSIAATHGKFSLNSTVGFGTSIEQVNSVQYRTAFDQPWSFNGWLRYQPRRATTAQLTWTTSTGQPRTPVSSQLEWHAFQPGTGSGEIEGLSTYPVGLVNSIRVAGPVRLDLGLRHSWTIRSGKGTPASGVSASILFENILNRADPVGVMLDANGKLNSLPGTARGLLLEFGWVY